MVVVLPLLRLLLLRLGDFAMEVARLLSWLVISLLLLLFLLYPRASPSPTALAGRTGEMGSTKKNSV